MGKEIHDASTRTGPALGPKLEVVRGENEGEVFKVKFKTRIGRERDNDVVLLDPKTSRYHAQIALEAGQWILKDLGSANGTYLNDAPLTAPTPLQAKDRIRMGETELLLSMPAQSSPETASSETLTAPPTGVSPRPGLQAQPAKGGQPRAVWIAGGVILLLCIAAVFVVSLVINRIGPDDTVEVSGPVPTESATDINGAGQPADTHPVQLPPELALVYEDDFSDSFGGWDDAFDAYTRKVYGNNRYQIEVQASNLVAWGLANRDVADFEIEVEARQEEGDEKSSYGLLFRFQDRDNFYRFDISGDGFYLLSKFVNGDWVTLVDWTESEFINKGSAGNILKVSAFGPNIVVYVNGQQLAAATDNTLTHGNFGFFAGTFSEPFTWVSYDNLKMWTPPGEEITRIPTATRPSAVAVANTSTPTSIPMPTPVSPIVTPTPKPQLVEGGTSSEATEPASTATVASTPTLTASPTPSPAPTATPVPLPEYASRDQTLARGEEKVTGRIVFPVYDFEREIYDVYIADAADGSNLELVQQNASQPALTSDGTEIAYRSWQRDKRGLFARPLTEEAVNAWGFDLFFEAARPQFSPVDKALMYFSRTGGDAPGVYGVIDGIGRVMRRDGFPIQGKSPKWAPNGKQFVYSSCLGSACGIILSNIDGSGPTQVTDHPQDTNPEVSPDGSTVVFMSERGGNWEIYRVDIDGDNLIALTSDSASDGLPTWSPDGSKIAFVSNRDGEWGVWSMDPDGSNKRRHFVIAGSIDGIVQHDAVNSFGWVEENIDWIP